MFKKISAFMIALSLAAVGMTGCGSEKSESASQKNATQASIETQKENNAANPKDNSNGSFSVVCTIFPEYDWVKEILGKHTENAEITYLLDNGVDLHSYQPTAEDMMKISTCDLFIYVGGESDEWVEDALDDADNKNMKVIALMDVLGDSAKAEELKEGMQADEEEHDHEENESEDHEEEIEYDEHVWLSLKNAKVFCTEIEKNLEAIDSANAADYKANLAGYTKELDKLDSSFKKAFDESKQKTLVFGDRFPFRYFVEDYGLDYYAAFIGCSAETEASFETISFLSDKVKELDCKTIYTLENSDKSIAETIISTSGKDVDIAELNSLQSVSKDDIKDGASYISLMQKNYNVLKEALAK